MDRYKLITNTVAYETLHRDAMSGRRSHAYLIVSPDERMGKELAETFLAEIIYGEGKREVHTADVIRLPREDKVKVEDVEVITDNAYLSPVELDKKFYVVYKAETMTDAAQNKLLKVLEEPPRAVTIILVAASDKSLLPTVISRVKRVEIYPAAYADVLAYLRDEYGLDGNAYLAAALSEGYPGKADAVMADGEYKRLFDAAVKTLTEMKNSKMVLKYSALIAGFKDRLSDFLDVMEILLADCMLASVGQWQSMRFPSSRKEIADIGAEYGADVVTRVLPLIYKARKRMEYNGNEQSVLDELLFSMLEVKAKCRKL